MLKRAFVRPAVIIDYLARLVCSLPPKYPQSAARRAADPSRDADAIGPKSWPVSFHDLFQLLKAGSFSPIQA